MTNPEAKVQYEGAILNQLVKNAEKLAVLETEFKQIKPKIDKIDGLEQRFDGLEQRFDGLEQRFDGLEQRFDGLEQRFDNLEQRFDGLEQRFDNLEQKVEELYSTLSFVKWLSVTIGVGIVINIFSQPILSLLF